MPIFLLFIAGFLNFSRAEKANSEAGYAYSDLKQTLLSSDVVTVSDLLSRLPQEMRTNYTLVHSSKSLQFSSFLSPRALLFGNTGKLILAFNGEPEKHGYNSIETASFNSSSQRIEFRKIVFRADSTDIVSWDQKSVAHAESLLPEEEVEFFDERILISKPNPQLCIGCHAADRSSSVLKPTGLVKYNWPAYSSWPDAYGSSDDINNSSAINWIQFLDFRKKAELDSRYKNLFADRENLSYPYHDGEPGHRIISSMPNTRLSYLTAVLFAKQTADLIAKTDWFQGQRNQIMLALLESPSSSIKTDIDLPPGFVGLKDSDFEYNLAGKVIDSAYSKLSLRFDSTSGTYSDYYNLPSEMIQLNNMQDAVTGMLIKTFEKEEPDLEKIMKWNGKLDPTVGVILKGAHPDFFNFLTENYFFNYDENRTRPSQLNSYFNKKLTSVSPVMRMTQ